MKKRKNKLIINKQFLADILLGLTQKISAQEQLITDLLSENNQLKNRLGDTNYDY